MAEERSTIRRILIVEDNPVDALLLRDALHEAARFSVTVVQTLAEAVVCVKADGFDLVLLDLNLPDSTGVRSLVSLHKETKVPIIVVTGVQEGCLKEVVVRGAEDYWEKERIDYMRVRFITSIRVAILRHERSDHLRELEGIFRKGKESLSRVIVKGMGELCLTGILSSWRGNSLL